MEQEQSQEKSSRWINALAICGILIWITVVVMVIKTVGVSSGSGSGFTVAEINVEDPFVEHLECEFMLSRKIPKYDGVISAIEAYYQDHGYYPEQLSALIPAYLDKEPGLYLRGAEYINYAVMAQDENSPPFIFSIDGHYPGLAFIHGWELMYCPATYSGCSEGGDRHIWTTTVNERWIWISSSAL